MKAENKIEYCFVVRLYTEQKINEPWLENQAILIEEALTSRCPDIPGPSVTANFAENGFELDLIIEATGMADAYDQLGQVLKVVEETAGISLGGASAGEVRSDFVSPETPDHDPALMPA